MNLNKAASLSETLFPVKEYPANFAYNNEEKRENYPWTIECFLEDLFLGSQWSIILGYIWLSVKFFFSS